MRWQSEKEKELAAAPPISSEPAIIKEQLEQIKSLRAIVDGCESHITTANELARGLIDKSKTGSESMPPLKEKLEKINEGWRRMDDTITRRLYDLESNLKRSQSIEKALEDIKKWLDEKEGALKVKDPLSVKHDELQEMLSKYSVSAGIPFLIVLQLRLCFYGATIQSANVLVEATLNFSSKPGQKLEFANKHHTLDFLCSIHTLDSTGNGLLKYAHK